MTNLGPNGLALDADRTRDQLTDALVEIRRRLTPEHIKRSFLASFRRRPAPFVAFGVGILSGTAAIVMLAVRSGHRRG